MVLNIFPPPLLTDGVRRKRSREETDEAMQVGGSSPPPVTPAADPGTSTPARDLEPFYREMDSLAK